MDAAQDPKMLTDTALAARIASYEEAIADAEKDLRLMYANLAVDKQEVFMRKHGLKIPCKLKVKDGVKRSLQYSKRHGNLCKLMTSEQGEVTHFILTHTLESGRVLYITVPEHRIEDMEVVND